METAIAQQNAEYEARAAKEALETREYERKRARAKRRTATAKQHAMNSCRDAHDRAKVISSLFNI